MGALSILIGAIGGVGGTEYRDYIRQETIRIDSSGSALAATADFEIEDRLGTPRFVDVREQSEITIDDGPTRLFGGWVKVPEDMHDGPYRHIRIRCTDYTLQLEESIVVDTFQAAGGTDRALILAMIGAWATDIDATVPGYVDTIRVSMPEMHFADVTCREALDQICKKTGGMYYVDFRKKLHYFLADEGDVVVPILTTEADTTPNGYPYTSNFVQRRDATKLVNNVRVVGNGVETWREDPASIAYYDNRRFQAVIRDSNADTTEEVEYLGDWFLSRYAWASYEFDVTCWIPGLRAGQSITLFNSVWPINGVYSIRKTNLRCTGQYPPVGPQYIVQLTLGYKDAPGRPDFDPKPDTPPVPPIPPAPVPPVGGWAKNVYIATRDFGVYYTSNFVADERYIGGIPTWATVNTGLNLAFDCLGFTGDPFDPAGRQYYLGADGLYRRVAGGNWTMILTKAAALALSAGTDLGASAFGERAITCNINVRGFIAIGFKSATGVTNNFGWCVSTDYGATWTWKLVVASGTSSAIFSCEVGALKGGSPYAAGTVWYCGILRIGANIAVYRSLDNGTTWTGATGLGPSGDECSILVDPNDQGRVFLSLYKVGGIWGTGVSTDHGATFARYDINATDDCGAPYAWYALSVCMDTNRMVRIGAFFLNPSQHIHKTTNNGLNWQEVTPEYANSDLGISLIQDAPNKLYLLDISGATVLLPHNIYATGNEGLNMTPKGGANANIADTGGGNSIPYNCGGVRGILQIWTLRANTINPSHELGSNVHIGELSYQQLEGIVGSGAGMIAAGDHHLLSATHGDALPAAVIRGDIVRGNSTPAWSRLALGGLGQVVTSDGIDAAWSERLGIRSIGRALYQPEAFGAIGDGLTHPLSTKYANLPAAQVDYPFALDLTDELDWCGIQKALNTAATEGAARTARWWAGGDVLVSGTYLTTRPILQPPQTGLVGSGETGAVIKKTTNTAGAVHTVAYNGINDVFAVDSIISLDHGVDGYSAYNTIKNVSMWNSTGAGAIGIFAPRAANLTMDNVQIEFCAIGITGYTWWVNHLKKVIVGLTAAGTRGIGVVYDGVNWPGTSTTLETCYVLGHATPTATARGYEFNRMAYMILIGCACDGLGSDAFPGEAYYFDTCVSTKLSACGGESGTGTLLRVTGAGQVVVDAMQGTDWDGVTAGTTAYLHLDTAKVSFRGCNFLPFTTPRNSLNAIYDAATVIFENTVEPTGGGAISYLNTPNIFRFLNGIPIQGTGTPAHSPTGGFFSGTVEMAATLWALDTIRSELIKPLVLGNTIDIARDSGLTDLRVGYGSAGRTLVAGANISGNISQLSLVGISSDWMEMVFLNNQKGIVITRIYTSALFDAAGLTDSDIVWTQPTGTILLSIKMRLRVKFVAAGMTDLDVTIGDGGDPDGLIAAAMNLTNDAVTTEYKTRGAYWNAAGGGGGYYAPVATDWTAYATAVGANLDTLTAGRLDFYITYLEP